MASTITLSSWQKKQAALLYHFASFDYLKGLHERVHQLQDYVDATLNKSQSEGRDRFLRDARWGNRDTSENWGNHAWSFLADFGLSVAKDMAARPSQIYSITGANQCARGMAEFSLQWMTSTEEKKFDSLLESVVRYARYIDTTMDKAHRAGRWNDFRLAMAWVDHSHLFNSLPVFKIREDINSETGEIPPKTGVYISTQHPEGSLQFAWNGNEYGKLKECAIFNGIGSRALNAVGRAKLWLDGNAMLEFVQKNLDAPELLEDSYFSKSHTPVLAPSLVGRNAFTSAPSKWCYVELVMGESEPVDAEPEKMTNLNQPGRFESGEICELGGFYFTPATGSRRFFRMGELFPETESIYGKTIWQWDDNQG